MSTHARKLLISEYKNYQREAAGLSKYELIEKIANFIYRHLFQYRWKQYDEVGGYDFRTR